MQSSSSAVGSAASLRSQTPTFQVKEIQVSLLKPIAEDKFIVASKFRYPLLTNGQGLLDVPENTRRAFSCPGCSKTITIPTDVLQSVNWALRTDGAGLKTKFHCERCGFAIDIGFSW